MSRAPDYLIVGINYFPEPTGIAPYTTDLARALSREGRVRVITGIPHYPWWRKQKHTEINNTPNLEVVRRNHFVPTRHNSFTRALMELSFGISVILGGKLNAPKLILISPAMLSSVMILMWVRLRRQKTKSVLWVQDLYEYGLREIGSGDGLSSRLVVQAERWLLEKTDHVVFAHKGFLAAQKSDLRSKSSCVANWSQFSYEPDAEPILKREGRIVLHIGNMGVKQGLENIIESAKLAELRKDNATFVLLGSGNQLNKLKDAASDCSKVVFLEPVDEKKLSSYLNSADILLVNEKPGVKEMSIPSKLTTYFQTGKPIIVCSESDSLAAQEVTKNKVGYWVESGNAKALLDTVLNLDLVQAGEVGKMAQAYARDKLSKAKALQQFIGILKKI